jgi:transketolase
LIPYGGTFLVFSDYMKPAIRIAAISHLPSIFVFTHDSVGLGEDGPTHQPVEHLAALRAVPHLVVIRPADANEVAEAWRIAIARRDGPTVLALTRQSVPVFDRSLTASADGLAKGAYVLAELGKGNPELILMASGSEVTLIYGAGLRLADEGHRVRIVSFPSWALFEQQNEAYRKSVLPPEVQARIAVEAGASQGWERYVGLSGLTIGLDHFGASAPYQTIFQHFGFTVDNVYMRAKLLLDSGRRAPAATHGEASAPVVSKLAGGL